MTDEKAPPGKGARAPRQKPAATNLNGSDSTARTDSPADRARGAIYRPSTERPRRTQAQLAEVDNAIMAALDDEHPATLRGTYYRVVSAGAVDKTEAGYRLVGRQVLKLRRATVLPYSWITDGTRWIVKPQTHLDVETMLADAAASYRRMLWHSQPVEVHLFTEKDAITGVIDSVTARWDVPLGVLRGYSSESFAWTVAEALSAAGKPVFIYQLGDHDPSGLDAWRDFTDKVTAFAPEAEVTFARIAVLPGQIEEWNLPTRPTKRSDTRAAGFVGGSVEVDAIAPSRLRQLVEEAIVQHIDPDAYRLTMSVEQSERDVLRSLAGDRR